MKADSGRVVAEIVSNRDECLKFLIDLKNFCPVLPGENYPAIYRLLVTPMLYSVWERCFTLCHAVGLRLIRECAQRPGGLGPSTRAVWLMHTSFYQSLVQKLQAQPPTDPKRIRRAGHFAILSTFLESFDVWAKESLDQKIDTGELVMTFSNVNQDVVEINAQAIGIVDTPAFKGLKLGRLHDLVGRRNEIGHGAVIEPPPNEHFLELWQFTESLINKYCDAFLEWVEVYTGEIEPDNLAIRRQKQARAIKRQSTMRKSPAWRRRNSSCE